MAARNARSPPRRAAAVAPYHITVLFSPDLRARDPRGRGSIGAGIVLGAEVRADVIWTPGPRTSVRLSSAPRVPLPISRDVARRLVGDRRGRLTVRLRHTLPVGQGFGSSAAGAVATALAVARALRLPRQRALETAHLAELFGGGGLGGVAAILGGGAEVRSVAGLPPWGRVRHTPFRPPIYVAITGPALPSTRLLRDPRFLNRVHTAAVSGMRRVGRRSEPERMLEAGADFARRLQLAPRQLRRTLEELRSPEIAAGQTMFGNALFAVPSSRRAERELRARLARLGLRTLRLRAARQGARIVRSAAARP